MKLGLFFILFILLLKFIKMLNGGKIVLLLFCILMFGLFIFIEENLVVLWWLYLYWLRSLGKIVCKNILGFFLEIVILLGYLISYRVFESFYFLIWES